MYQLDFQKPVHIHFIGIGGISMSGLAEILLDRGFMISGSDREETLLTKQLCAKGARISYPQSADNLTGSEDLVVYTAAIHPDNPEYAKAVQLGIPLLSRAELLGQMMQNYDFAIAVSGTHGKTTTTSMLAHILLAADTDPTVSVGGMLPVIGGKIRNGGERYFLTEACEYTNSFLSFFPTVGIILNVEEDHLDFFEDLADIRNSFRKFAALLPPEGALVLNADIEDPAFFFEGLDCNLLTFSIHNPGQQTSEAAKATQPQSGEAAKAAQSFTGAQTGPVADYTAADLVFDEFALPTFTALYKGEPVGSFSLKIPGEHNVSNALAAIAAARFLGIDVEAIREGLSAFTGTDRRFQYKGRLGGAVLIDDYAHHPTEIRASLTTAGNYPHKRIRCIFQPHTYSRTAAFLDDFAGALSLADEVILAEIYAARETNTFGISSADLAEKIRSLGVPCSFYPTFAEIEEKILSDCVEGDLILTMGAGNVFEIGDHLLEAVESDEPLTGVAESDGPCAGATESDGSCAGATESDEPCAGAADVYG